MFSENHGKHSFSLREVPFFRVQRSSFCFQNQSRTRQNSSLREENSNFIYLVLNSSSFLFYLYISSFIFIIYTIRDVPVVSLFAHLSSSSPSLPGRHRTVVYVYGLYLYVLWLFPPPSVIQSLSPLPLSCKSGPCI